MIIIPAIDIISGECVRLTQGDYSAKTTYYKEPLDVAKRYEDAGFKRLHLVDLDGAKASKPLNLKTLEKIATRTSLEVQYGGGLKSDESVRVVFESGASRAICGSIAVTNADLFARWLVEYGSSRMILGADTKAGKVAINGWEKSSLLSVEELLNGFEGLTQVICTDISCDGMLTGPNFKLYEKLQNEYPQIDITVSGGISSINDLEKLVEQGARSVVVGKAIYEGRVTLSELYRLNQS